MNEVVKEKQFLTDVSNELTRRLVDESKAIGGTFNSQRFIMNSIEALRQLELIDKPLTPKQVVNGLMKGAYLNLDFFTKDCYLIYYKGKGLQFQTDYKGEVKLAKMYSVKPIFEIYAEVVREGDEYEKITIKGDRTINHKPLRFNTNPIEGAYAIVKYQDGSTDLAELSIKEIEAIRQEYSKAPNSPAWTKRYPEMCKKTVLRLLCKNIQLNFTTEQYSAYNNGGDCEFKTSEEIAVNPFEAPEQTSEPEVVEAEVVTTPTASAETEGFICSECGAEISDKVHSYSMEKFGVSLCFNCQKKRKNND